MTGSSQLCVFEQFCAPGLGAPNHLHAVEEVLTVVSGEAEIWVDGVHQPVSTGQSVIIPAGLYHGFRNTGRDTLHVRATIAASMFEASYENSNEVTRRWMP